jgi:Binding domain of Nse4/EID3 to Nse3-MAGE
MASHMSAMKARSMKSSAGAFDVESFVSKLITFMGGRKQTEEADDDDNDAEVIVDGDAPLDWDKVGRKALAKSRRVPAMDFMSVLSWCKATLTLIFCLFQARTVIGRAEETRARKTYCF